MFNVQQRVITSILKKKTKKGIFPLKTLGCQSQGPELDMDPDVFSPDQEQNDLGKKKNDNLCTISNTDLISSLAIICKSPIMQRAWRLT